MIESLAKVFATHGVVVPQTRWSPAPAAPKPPDNSSDNGSGFASEGYRLSLSTAPILSPGYSAAAPIQNTGNPPEPEQAVENEEGGDEGNDNGIVTSAASGYPARTYGGTSPALGNLLDLSA